MLRVPVLTIGTPTLNVVPAPDVSWSVPAFEKVGSVLALAGTLFFVGTRWARREIRW